MIDLRRTVLVELQLAGAWVDVSRWVLQTEATPVTIVRGRRDEASKTAPSVLTLSLNDGPTTDGAPGADGHLSPHNPLSPWYGELGENTPIRVTVDGSRRFTGEVSAWVPGWTPDHAYRAIAVTASGILRRLRQGRSPVQSAPRRYIPTSLAGGVEHAPAAYWPLEDGELAGEGAAVVGAHPARLNSTRDPSEHFGQGELASWLPNGLALWGGDELVAAVDMPDFADEWAVDHVQRNGLTTDVQLVVWTTAGGVWKLRFVAATRQIEVTWPGGSFTYGPFTVDLWDGQPHHVRFYTLQPSGSPDTNFYVDLDAVPVANGILAGVALDAVAQIGIGDLTPHTDDWAVAHLVVYYGQRRPTADFARPVLGWQGETAGRRLKRFCEENGITFTWSGDLDATPPMGPQRPAAVLALVDECVDVDLGMLTESRTALGLHYLTRAALYNLAPAATLNYAGGQVAPPFEPVTDDQLTRNRIIVRRPGGGEITAELATGPKSTQPHPDGVGVYDHEHTANVQLVNQLGGIGGWLLHLGTIAEPRYPRLTVDFAAAAVDPVLDAAVLAADVGQVLVVTGMQAAHVYDDVRLFTLGYVEVLRDQRGHRITFNCSPASAYDVYEIGAADRGRLHPTSSTLATAARSDAGSLSVATAAGSALWTTAAADMPIRIRVAGAELLVTAIAGAASPQTFTTRMANGVAKLLPADAAVELASGHVWAL